MRIVIQKVKQASVTVDSQVVSSIQKGLVLLVGISTEDTEAEVEKMSSKVLKMRIFEDEAHTNLWKRTVKDANAQILSGKSSPSLFFLSKYLKILTAMLLVSQFTLMAGTKKGTKPDLHMAAKGPQAKPLYDQFLQRLKADLGEDNVKDGVFGAMMDVSLVNDGPVTITLDSDE
ncbi:D-tyrosyl-tRNA(Tyr) deacylase [Cyberlindnera fabianii]|uniref:D-aminoacyl-tRNA deacylase n=1 Tax=Cyberlindnera fabianii TaxID=36022 RepID=A0A1V2L7K1_CYBFA|nr:D-tyrosyl-tRNA(Tyr) deacylase [Cyberlindnera fabianii]